MTTFKISFNGNGQIRIDHEETRSSITREFKGTSANKHVDNYCIVDLETTGVFVGSSKIIEISALKVRNNHVIDEFSTLINPHCHIPAEATAVNHITDEMVKDAPALVEVLDSFLSFVEDDVIVGYNNAAFDMNLLYDNVIKLKGVPFSNDYLDLLHASRRSIEGLENYKLETISNHYGLDTTGEHRALKDCYLTKSCYDKLFEEYGDDAFKKRSRTYVGREIQYSSETFALQELQVLLKGIIDDGEVTLDEVNSLRYWIEEHRDLSGHYPFDKAFNALDDVLEDGNITSEELDDLKSIFSEILDPVKCHSCHDDIASLLNKHVCLTGEFAYGAKSEVEKLISDAGGIVDKNVKKSTNFVVVGAQGSDVWKAGNYGGKIQKAMEYNAKGTNIIIVEEVAFIPRVKYLIAHPEENEECDNIEGSEENSSIDWRTPIQEMLNAMVVEKELPENSLGLIPNYGRDGQKITSYSICIYEPDYPLAPNAKRDSSRNSIILNIKESTERLELLINSSIFSKLEEPEGAEIKTLKSVTVNTHVFIPKGAELLVSYIKRITEYELANYVSKAASFGCCSKYIECSDAKHCVHENKLYSKACMYRTNLDSGRIFYGKNRNVD